MRNKEYETPVNIFFLIGLKLRDRSSLVYQIACVSRLMFVYFLDFRSPIKWKGGSLYVRA